MSERMAAEIHIGGKVPRSVAQALCKVIDESGASLEWGGGVCHPTTPHDLLQARSGDPLVLKLFDDQARWGEFASLEAFLREHGVPYARWSEGKYEYDAQAVAFHPQCGQLSWTTDNHRQPIVSASGLAPIEAKLTNLLETVKRGEAEAVELLAQIEGIRDGLRAELPPAVPPLEPLQIVED